MKVGSFSSRLALISVLYSPRVVRGFVHRARYLSAAPMNYNVWKDLEVEANQLRPEFTLNIGQCFNWKKLPFTSSDVWIGVLADKALLIKQTDQSTHCLSLLCKNGQAPLQDFLMDYFQLCYNLQDLYKDWGSGCARMLVVTDLLKGVRVVRQDPWECLISFICSSNNNIARITQMLDKLRRRYGTYLCTIQLVKFNTDAMHPPDDALPIDFVPCADMQIVKEENSSYYWRMSHTPASAAACDANSEDVLYSQELYAFPTVEALAGASEEELRALGMGYRAKFILGSAKLVLQKSLAAACDVKEENGASGHVASGAAWFEELRRIAFTARQPNPNESAIKTEPNSVDIKYECTTAGSSFVDVKMQKRMDEARLQVQQELLQLPGVGRKVADCVALFSLDQTGAIPVDTHVWNIAIRDYAPQLRRSQIKEENDLGTPQPDDLFSPVSSATKKRKAATPSSSNRSNKELNSGTMGISPLGSLIGLSSPEPADGIETKSLTPAVYEAVGDVFRCRFGAFAGWAHSVLFAAELGSFRERLPPHLQEQMRSFADQQRSAKKAKRDEKKETAQQKLAGGVTTEFSIEGPLSFEAEVTKKDASRRKK